MKRVLSILLAAVMILSTFGTTIMGVAATTASAVVDAEDLYLSDIAPISWKIFDGCTPGYDVYFEDGTPLLLAGVTYAKGLSTHPAFTYDAEFIYDISSYDHTAFTAIVGKTDRYVAEMPGSLTSFYVYVDGVLADSVVDLVAGETYTFLVNVAGASELKLVTGGGSDYVGCEGVVWANARLTYDTVAPIDPPVGPSEPPVDPEEPLPEGLYLSDITPTSWKMFEGNTPGYNVYFEDGTPLLLAGATYAKGLSTHPAFTYDAEFVYDISSYDHTAFTAIVGKTDRYVTAFPDSFTSFHVYVDGVLVDEVIDLAAGETYTFHINVAGASELKLVTSGGSDNVTGDGVIWANARLFMGLDDCGDHIWGEGRVMQEPTCTEVGQMKYQCTNCIQTKTEDIPVVPHTAGAWDIGEEASCTEAGTRVQMCSECGKVMDTTVWDAKGHIPGAWVTIRSATCTEAGKTAQTCQLCGIVMAEEEIPAVGHFFGNWGIVDGQLVRVCDCGEQEVKELSLESGSEPLLYIGASVVILIIAGTVTFLLIKKNRKGK